MSEPKTISLYAEIPRTTLCVPRMLPARSFRSIMLTISGLVIALALTSFSFADERLSKGALFVKQFAWTNAVTTEKEIDTAFRDRAPLGPLVLWTKIAGTQETLDYMKSKGQLPIWHRWFVSCGQKVGALITEKPVDEIDLRILRKRKEIIAMLQYEIDNRGASNFDWRTWSRKNNISNDCSYEVHVVDNWGRLLFCSEIAGDCKLGIHVGK